mgnify:CR=1 FL=1
MIDEIYVFAFFILITGACIGSFLNVVALRALSKESIVFPSSKCPVCNTPIKWYDNIPIFSYFVLLRGRCRNCKEKISIQYPIVEFICAVLFLLIFMKYEFSWQTLFLMYFGASAIVKCLKEKGITRTPTAVRGFADRMGAREYVAEEDMGDM